MPANIVKPGLERYWERAKKRAAEEGHAEDWPYVVGIYKRMTTNKSTAAEVLTPAERLEKQQAGLDQPLSKALVIPQGGWSYRVPGQVPDMQRERRQLRQQQRYLDGLTSKKPKPNTAENEAADVERKRYLKTADDVLRGLGFNSRERLEWKQRLESWKSKRLDEAAARAELLDIVGSEGRGWNGEQSAATGVDPEGAEIGRAERRRALVARALRWRRQSLESGRVTPSVDGHSRVRVLSLDELRRSEAPSSVRAPSSPRGRKARAPSSLRKALLERLPASPSAAELSDLAEQWGASTVAREAGKLLQKGEACYHGGRLREPTKGKRKRKRKRSDRA